MSALSEPENGEYVLDAPSDPSVAVLAPDTVIGGKYRIKRMLGAGGNGAVYEGEHTEVGHRVAIKVVHPQLAAREETLARFRREARICGSLRHPHIGQVYDVGMLDDGSPYMVMELQEGRSLADVLDDTTLPLPAVIDIVCQLLAGLGAAHHAGSIHRDVKPDNVMIVRDHSGAVVVKLVDFGISKSLTTTQADKHSVTGEGIIIGSPDYMSPEQLRGEPVDVRVDVYATGVLLYESITRHLPFEGESMVDLMASIMRDPVIKPSVLRSDCPPELDAVVLKALSKKAQDRYESADEMSRALSAVRAVLRALPTPSLADLDTRSIHPAAPVAPRRRRTIDSLTLNGLRAQVALAQRAHRKPSAKHLGAGVAGLATLALGVFFASQPSVTRERVVVQPLAPAAAPLMAAPAAVNTPAAPNAASAAQPQASAGSPTDADGSHETTHGTTHAAASAAQDALAAAAAHSPPQATTAAQVATPPRAQPRPAAPAREPRPRATSSTTRGEPAAAAPAEPVQALLKEAASSFALGDTAKAVSLYQRIVKASPREAAAWRGLGVAEKARGARTQAVHAFTRYLELRPNAPDAERVRAQLEDLR